MYGAAGPTFGIVGFLVGPVQTLGAALLLVSTATIAAALVGKRTSH